MACETIRLPSGTTAIVCGVRRPKCKSCGRPAKLECDWKMPKSKSGTCDAAICERCATSIGPDKDLCPKHSEAFEEWKAAKGQSRLL